MMVSNKKEKNKKSDQIHELKTRIDERLHSLAMSKFLSKEVAMRMDIVVQYYAEYERIKELAAATYHTAAGPHAFHTSCFASPIGCFKKSTFTPRAKSSRASESPVFGGHTKTIYALTSSLSTLAQMLELDVQARMLNEELRHQTIMYDGLVEQTDTTKAHVESINKTMKDAQLRTRRSPNNA
ncbi:unnamed protein product [Peronospora belbahrii]|uniref:t-SNARE coiled-coil homology domain-containing protein n=1 Tax=Peronospora belbahrii TaxID=622444 RepID=A0AAU9KPT2_9STRA|nr:unnamed protein product [Peronospora belbahrii]